jgi:DNA polymerase III gamma/tau subunit
VQYAADRGRYKVYLIDEVHMLSTHSFNALLKTLEEPPPHVKFLLATTDPQKLPVTVLSRCLQFNLKRLPVATIVARLEHILGAEKIAYDAAALRLVAVAADGSLRDALSLLDQLLAYGDGEARDSAARAMLGTVDRQQVVGLAQRLADHDAAGLLQYALGLEQYTPDYAQLLDELNSLFTQVALRQVVPDLTDESSDHPPELLADLAARIGREDLQLYYQIGVTGRRDLALAPDPREGFAMTLLRMLAFRPAAVIAAGGAVPAAPGAGGRAAAGRGAVRVATGGPGRARRPPAPRRAPPRQRPAGRSLPRPSRLPRLRRLLPVRQRPVPVPRPPGPRLTSHRRPRTGRRSSRVWSWAGSRASSRRTASSSRTSPASFGWRSTSAASRSARGRRRIASRRRCRATSAKPCASRSNSGQVPWRHRPASSCARPTSGWSPRAPALRPTPPCSRCRSASTACCCPIPSACRPRHPRRAGHRFEPRRAEHARQHG